MSPLLEAGDVVEALEALRRRWDVLEALLKRDSLLAIECSSVGAGTMFSSANVGGLMSSWVLLSERMIVNGGGDSS